MKIDEQLSAKYGEKVFMYTEYPPKGVWSREFGNGGYTHAWRDFFEGNPQAPVMLYLHMPYCLTQCLFCTCIVEISKDYADIKNYLAVLAKEIGLLAKLFDGLGFRPNVREVHLGGGSPTLIRVPEFEALMAQLGTILDFGNLSEFSIEIDPRHSKENDLRYYASKGINRISFGVQEFDRETQKAVNRIQPAYLTERLLKPEIRRLFAHGVNFDIICGLPHQTTASIRNTMEQLVAMSPDRVCLNYLDMAPHYNPHQLLMPQEAIPNHRQRRENFIEARDVLVAGGYVQTSFDHFAKPDDSVVRAEKEGKMIWNTLGPTPGDCVDVLGIGVSSISHIGDGCYTQNFYDIVSYSAALEAGRMPVFRGVRLSPDDKIRRDVINRIRNYFRIGFSDFRSQFGLDFREYFENEIAGLKELADDGLVAITDSEIAVTELGRQFANHAAKAFDAYLPV